MNKQLLADEPFPSNVVLFTMFCAMLCLCFYINRTQNNNNEQPMNRSQLVVGPKVLSLSHAVMRMNWPHNICGGDAELVGAKEILGSHDVR